MEPTLGQAGRCDRVELRCTKSAWTMPTAPGLLARYPHEFSGGQRQRLAIARTHRAAARAGAGRTDERTGCHHPAAVLGLRGGCSGRRA